MTSFLGCSLLGIFFLNQNLKSKKQKRSGAQALFLYQKTQTVFICEPCSEGEAI
jgi:hypothetical protein